MIICFLRVVYTSVLIIDKCNFFVADLSNSHFYECHSNQWSGAGGWILLHDLPVPGSRVWRGCGGPVLSGNLCRFLYVHYRIGGNFSGRS